MFFPENLRYTETHEWVLQEDDEIFKVGITDYAQAEITDVVFVELPKIDKYFEKGKAVTVIESVKAAFDIYAPLSGKIIAVNEDLNNHPEYVNREPYGKGWIFKIKSDNPQELKTLLTSSEYQDKLK